jgi:putative membrane protein
MKFKSSTLLGLGAALSLVVCTQAFARSDAAFMKQAAENGHAEVEASKLAQTKARRPEVKAFAEHMIADHTKVNDELKQIAAAKKVELPAEPSVMQKGKLKMINTGSDDKFDDRYEREFGVKAHEDTIKLFQTAANEAQDSDVKAFAQKTLPSLQSHLEMARKLAGNSGSAAAGKSSNQSMQGESAGKAGTPAKP